MSCRTRCGVACRAAASQGGIEVLHLGVASYLRNLRLMEIRIGITRVKQLELCHDCERLIVVLVSETDSEVVQRRDVILIEIQRDPIVRFLHDVLARLL